MDDPQRMAQVFVELADTLSADFDVVDLLQTLSDRCVELVGADASGLMLTDQRGGLQLVAATLERARMLELFELQVQEGPCLECFGTGQAITNVVLASAEANRRWPEFTPAAAEAGFGATHALPMRLRGRVIGALNLFTDDQGQQLIQPFNAATVFLIVLSLTAGTILLMWMGELITQRGIGNGISLMIFASIASRIPNGIHAWYTNSDKVFVVIMPFLALGVIAAIVFIQEGQRRIPVQYAKRVIGRRMSGGGQTYLPLRAKNARRSRSRNDSVKIDPGEYGHKHMIRERKERGRWSKNRCRGNKQ